MAAFLRALTVSSLAIVSHGLEVRTLDSQPGNVFDTGVNALFDGINIERIFGGTTGSQTVGTFTNGPQLIGDGLVLSTGLVTNVMPGRDPRSESNRGSSQFYPPCGPGSFPNVAGFAANAQLLDTTELTLSFVFATDDLINPDVMAVTFDGTPIALDFEGNQINARDYFTQPDAGDVPPPASGISYARSSRLQTITISDITPGPHTYIFAVCDVGDAFGDSALFVSFKPSRPAPSVTSSSTTTSSEETSSTTTTSTTSTDSSSTSEEVSTSESSTSSSTSTPSGISTSSSVSSSIPSPPPPTRGSDLQTIGNFGLSGCLSSSTGFPGFIELGRSEEMTTPTCIQLAGEEFEVAGVFNRTCCGRTSAVEQVIRVPPARCNLPCPGDGSLNCGGLTRPDAAADLDLRSLERRDIPTSVLLTFYERISRDDLTTITSVATTHTTIDLWNTGVKTATDYRPVPGEYPKHPFGHGFPTFSGRVYFEHIGYCDSSGRCWDEQHSGEDTGHRLKEGYGDKYCHGNGQCKNGYHGDEDAQTNGHNKGGDSPDGGVDGTQCDGCDVDVTLANNAAETVQTPSDGGSGAQADAASDRHTPVPAQTQPAAQPAAPTSENASRGHGHAGAEQKTGGMEAPVVVSGASSVQWTCSSLIFMVWVLFRV